MIERLAVGHDDAAGVARHVRGYIPAPAAVHEVVAGIVASVEEGGDAALVMHERRFGGGDGPLLVPAEELQAALARRGINTSVSSASGTLLDMDERGLKSVIRASVHYYNSEAELERFVATVAELVRAR